VYTQRTRNGMPKGARAPSSMLRTGEACRILCIHANTLRRWSEQGIIKAYRVGPRGDRRFRREDIAALLIAQTKDSSADGIKLSHQ
jgi:excisionase family DNA binding protein